MNTKTKHGSEISSYPFNGPRNENVLTGDGSVGMPPSWENTNVAPIPDDQDDDSWFIGLMPIRF